MIWLVTASKPLRTSNAKFVCGIGLMAGFFYASESSLQRLMGLYPNESEVRRYGVMSPEKLERKAKRAAVDNIDLISTEEDD